MFRNVKKIFIPMFTFCQHNDNKKWLRSDDDARLRSGITPKGVIDYTLDIDINNDNLCNYMMI